MCACLLLGSCACTLQVMLAHAKLEDVTRPQASNKWVAHDVQGTKQAFSPAGKVLALVAQNLEVHWLVAESVFG